MKILFIMRNQAYVRNYESTIKDLANRGHDLKVVFNDYKDNDRLIERLNSEYQQINYSYEKIPDRCDEWSTLVKLIRALKDYLRYLYPEYIKAKKLRKRIEKHLGIIMVACLQGLRWLPKQLGVEPLTGLIEIIEKIIPEDKAIIRFLEQENPDLVLVTPLLDFDSVQTDYLKCANKLGIKCGLCVHSWDNLTSKGVIHVEPDRIFVWNKIQKQEAIDFHRISADKVIVTGAQCYDKWFERNTSTSLESFIERVGLEVGKNYLLYLCSSGFIAPQEFGFVQELLQQMRNAEHPQIRALGLLVRPHPQNAQQWDNIDLSAWNNTVIWPPGGQNPVTEESKANFYDSIYHSVAVVGVNTSAMIESGILGKPVYSILDPRFKDTQAGTLHFHHLVRGGLLQLSHSIEEYIQQLILRLEGKRDQEGEQIRQFIYEFVRPYGLDTPCTPILVKSIEAMADLPSVAVAPLPFWGVCLRVFLLPIALIVKESEYLYRKVEGKINQLFVEPLSRKLS